MNDLLIKSVLEKATEFLKNSESDEPEANAEWLLANELGVSRTWLVMHYDSTITEEQFNHYWQGIIRKSKGEPLSHIVGVQPFCGMDIIVSADVLTPRPETEELVDLVLQHFDKKGKYRFLDMCTGSGCIAIALAKNFSNSQVSAVDISEKALNIAFKNSKKFRVDDRVKLIQSDVWENVQGNFDLIISNPPYIPSEIVDTLTKEVLCEPRIALDGGTDGLDIVRSICSVASDYLNSNGLLALELCKGQAQAVARGLEEIGWKTIVKKDIFGIERFVLASKR